MTDEELAKMQVFTGIQVMDAYMNWVKATSQERLQDSEHEFYHFIGWKGKGSILSKHGLIVYSFRASIKNAERLNMLLSPHYYALVQACYANETSVEGC